MEKEKKHKTLKRIILCCIAAVIVVVAVIALRYANDPFPETQAIADEMEMDGGDYWYYGDSNVGFILFAGAKTEEASYSYLAELLNDEGYTVVIPKQLFNLSVFGSRHGMEIMEEHDEIDKWILIGHSMGGWPVSRIADTEPDRIIGIAFLATYATRDLSDLPFPAIRISAENDGIMNNERMDSRSDRLPEGSESIMLEGANHRGFGGYASPFKGDGEASITWQEQNEEAISLILEFFADEIEEAEKNGSYTFTESDFNEDEDSGKDDSAFAASWQEIRDYGFASKDDFGFANEYWDDSYSYSQLSFSLTGGTVADEGDYFSIEAVFNKPVKVPADLQPGESYTVVINELTGEEKTFTAVLEEGTGASYYKTEDGWECWTTNIDSNGNAELLEGSSDRLDAPFYKGVLRISKDAVTGAAVTNGPFDTVTESGLSQDDWFNVLAFDESGYVKQLIFEGD